MPFKDEKAIAVMKIFEEMFEFREQASYPY
jgi:hypothetical protein